MNFTTVRGYNAYALISAKVREAVKNREDTSENKTAAGAAESKNPKPAENTDISRSVYTDPVDTVTISKPALKASAALAAMSASKPPEDREKQQLADTRVNLPVITIPSERSSAARFREWLRTTGVRGPSGVMTGSFTQKVPGRLMNGALAGTGISVGDNEEYTVKVDLLSTVTVAGRNAEKAKAIQDLLSTTPSGINWGLLLATLPPM